MKRKIAKFNKAVGRWDETSRKMVVTTLNLPTREQCLNYFQEYHVPKHIFEHCLWVEKVAVMLAQQLINAKVSVRFELVSRLALLHDLFKMAAIDHFDVSRIQGAKLSPEEEQSWSQLKTKYPGMYECEIGHQVFKGEFPELAQSLKKVGRTLDEEKTIEEKIVQYADWRVRNNQVVTIAQRLQDLKKHYPKGEEYWGRRAEAIQRVEQDLFQNLDFQPEQLNALLSKSTAGLPWQKKIITKL